VVGPEAPTACTTAAQGETSQDPRTGHVRSLMTYSHLTIDSDSAIKRFSHRKRFSLARQLLAVSAGHRVLDYGAGDGYFLRFVRSSQPAAMMVAYDPSQEMLSQIRGADSPRAIDKAVSDVSSMEDHSFDRIACLEVLEHLTEKEQVDTLRQIRRLLADDGLLLVSVPIEIGPSAIAKNVARLIARHPHPGASLLNLIRSAFGMAVARDAARLSHIGFDHRDLKRLFPRCGLEIEATVCSPWPLLGSLLNSQIFFVLRPALGAPAL
jgi:2-polyprenyl-3-methyl-5-hydroxy-6-metoxy-1,4-benzoquinol methylase